MCDKICTNFDENNKAETMSDGRIENEKGITSEVTDVVADDSMSYQKTINLTSQHQGKMDFLVVLTLVMMLLPTLKT